MKKGDIVVCIDDSGCSTIIKGKEYKIKLVTPNYIYIYLYGTRISSCFLRNRFQSVIEKQIEMKEGDRVICIDNIMTSLHVGEVYKIRSLSGGHMVVVTSKPGRRGQYLKSRFKLVPLDYMPFPYGTKVVCMNNILPGYSSEEYTFVAYANQQYICTDENGIYSLWPNVKVKQQKVTFAKKASHIMKYIEDNNWSFTDGEWHSSDSREYSFIPEMFAECSKPITNKFEWHPDWVYKKEIHG